MQLNLEFFFKICIAGFAPVAERSRFNLFAVQAAEVVLHVGLHAHERTIYGFAVSKDIAAYLRLIEGGVRVHFEHHGITKAIGAGHRLGIVLQDWAVVAIAGTANPHIGGRVLGGGAYHNMQLGSAFADFLVDVILEAGTLVNKGFTGRAGIQGGSGQLLIILRLVIPGYGTAIISRFYAEGFQSEQVFKVGCSGLAPVAQADILNLLATQGADIVSDIGLYAHQFAIHRFAVSEDIASDVGLINNGVRMHLHNYSVCCGILTAFRRNRIVQDGPPTGVIYTADPHIGSRVFRGRAQQ